MISFSNIYSEPEGATNISSVQNQNESDVNNDQLNLACSSCSQPENADSLVGKSVLMTSHKKREILRSCLKPSENNEFRQDAIDPKRCFIHSWMQIYTPWLVYSKKLEDALFLYLISEEVYSS